MVYEGMETVICDAEENDWLSVSYHEQKYADSAPAAKKARKMPRIKLGKFNKKIAAVCAVIALCVAALACMLFIDGNFSADVFGAVKSAYSSNVFDSLQPQPVTVKLTIPSVTVAIDENTNITYQGLSEVYVTVDSTVSANALLGKYDGEFTATVSVAGQTKQVVGSESQLTWNV